MAKTRQLPGDPDSNWNKQDDDQAWKDAVKQAADIVDSIDNAPEEIADKAMDFFESVRTGAVSIGETIEKTRRVSEKQQKALDNWEAGVNRWLENHHD